jgi:hypothetical protein
MDKLQRFCRIHTAGDGDADCATPTGSAARIHHVLFAGLYSSTRFEGATCGIGARVAADCVNPLAFVRTAAAPENAAV